MIACDIEDHDMETIEWFKNLLQIDTTNSHGNEMEAALYIQQILKKEAIDSDIFESEPGRANLIAKLKGGNEPPLLLISHLDVVGADESKWIHPPFAAVEDEGEICARGTLDTKHLTIMELAAFIELKRQRVDLNRDVYFIATADEENGSEKGMAFMTEQHPECLPKGAVVNESGGFYIPFRGQDYLLLSVGEKGICSFTIDAGGQGGHASCPPENQAVQKLAAAVKKLIDTPFPASKLELGDLFLDTLGVKNGETADACFDSTDENEKMLDTLHRYMGSNDINVNRVDVGEQINAVPYKASAEIMFRLLPGISESQVEDFLQQTLERLDVNLKINNFREGFINDPNSQLVSHFQGAVHKFGFKGKLLPFLGLGNTDGRFLKDSMVYGFSPVSSDTPFTTVLNKVHNHNESISVRSFLFGTHVLKETTMNYCQNN